MLITVAVCCNSPAKPASGCRVLFVPGKPVMIFSVYVGDEIYLNFNYLLNTGPNTLTPARNISCPVLGEVNNFMSYSEKLSREKAGTVSLNGELKPRYLFLQRPAT